MVKLSEFEFSVLSQYDYSYNDHIINRKLLDKIMDRFFRFSEFKHYLDKIDIEILGETNFVFRWEGVELEVYNRRIEVYKHSDFYGVYDINNEGDMNVLFKEVYEWLI